MVYTQPPDSVKCLARCRPSVREQDPKHYPYAFAKAVSGVFCLIPFAFPHVQGRRDVFDSVESAFVPFMVGYGTFRMQCTFLIVGTLLSVCFRQHEGEVVSKRQVLVLTVLLR